MSPGVEAILATVAVNAIAGIGLFAGRNWLKAWIERGVQHRFDQRIETLRTELRNTEERLKSELRIKETELSALRDAVLSGRAGRQSLLDKRRLEAVDNLWASFNSLGPYRNVARMMGVINVEEVKKNPQTDPKIKQFFAFISNLGGEPKQPRSIAKNEQVFISPLGWAYFQAYSMIVYSSFAMAKAFENGLADIDRLFKKDSIGALIKAVLPHYGTLVDEWDINLYHNFLDELEEKLVAELKTFVEGKEQAQSDLTHSAEILRAVNAAVAADSANEGNVASALSVVKRKQPPA